MDNKLFLFSTFITKIVSNILSIMTLLVTFWVIIDRKFNSKQNLLSTYNQKLVFFLMVFAFMYSVSNVLYPNSSFICKLSLFLWIVGYILGSFRGTSYGEVVYYLSKQRSLLNSKIAKT
jgi:hypothetical protein